jgi:type IV secretory pathway TraG/TraD family ATPase VirD4
MSPIRDTLRFGAVDLPASVATSHFLFVGTTGSGKTTLLRLLEQSVLDRIGTGVDARAIVRDAKQDAVPQLESIAPHADRVILHPFDSRGVAWDLSADIRSPEVAIEIAFTLVPSIHESQPFFSDAARHLVYGVILSFMLSGLDWSLADLLRVLQSRRLLKATLRKHPETREMLSQYFSDSRVAANILSTIATKFLPFGPMAAAWEHAKRRVSLTEWGRSEMILILGNSEISRNALLALNRCMFKRASDITLSSTESTTRRNWFIVDELSEAGRLDGFVSLAKMGRSKGACLVVAFQSVAALRDPQLYGLHFSEDVLAQFGHRAIGRVECAASAEWASALVGDQEVMQVTRSKTVSDQGTSRTESKQSVTRRAVLPSEIMDFKPCNLRNGLSALFFIPSIGVGPDTINGPDLFEHQLLAPADIPGFIPRPVDQQYLRPWPVERERLFGIPERRRKGPRPDSGPDQKRPDQAPPEHDDLDGLFS